MTNRVIEALRAIGGAGTVQDITRVCGGRPACISSQLSALERRGRVHKGPTRTIRVRRWWRGTGTCRAHVWSLA